MLVKKSKPEEIIRVKHYKSLCLFRQGVTTVLAEGLFFQFGTSPLKLELASSDVQSASIWWELKEYTTEYGKCIWKKTTTPKTLAWRSL